MGEQSDCFFCPFDRRNPHCTLLVDQPQQPLIQLREAAGWLRHKIITTWHFKRASYEHRLSGHTVLTADQLRTSEWLEAAPFLILSQTWTPFMSNYIQIIFTNKRLLESRAQQLACGYEGRKKINLPSRYHLGLFSSSSSSLLSLAPLPFFPPCQRMIYAQAAAQGHFLQH